MTKATRQFVMILLGLAIGLSIITAFAFRDIGWGGGKGVAAIGGPFDLHPLRTVPIAKRTRIWRGLGPISYSSAIRIAGILCPATLTEYFRRFEGNGRRTPRSPRYSPPSIRERDTPQTMKTYLVSFYLLYHLPIG